jgi:hypothetical protein
VESCINRTLNEFLICVSLTCINKEKTYSGTKNGPKEVVIRQTSLYCV